MSYSGNKGEHAADTLIHAFTAMNRPKADRVGLPAWAAAFEYVNGGLFAGAITAPRFDPIAFRYLRDAADLNWKLINPDIFGSMIQSIADAKARSELGMHYTSVPNIMNGGSGNDELSGGDNSDFLLGFCRAAGAELCQRGNRRRSELGALGLGQHASRQTGADRRRRAPEAVAKLAGFHAQCIISASPSTSNAAFISGSYPGSIRAGP